MTWRTFARNHRRAPIGVAPLATVAPSLSITSRLGLFPASRQAEALSID
jgi:hypothetical protein